MKNIDRCIKNRKQSIIDYFTVYLNKIEIFNWL